MTKLALAAFALAGLTQATGCIAAEDEAQFSLAWTISQGGAASDCTIIGANGVSFVFTGPGQAFNNIYDCAPASHDSPSMVLGAYTISGSLIDDADPNNVIIFDQLNVTSSLDVVGAEGPGRVRVRRSVGRAGRRLRRRAWRRGRHELHLDWRWWLGRCPAANDLYDAGAGACLATFHITGTKPGEPGVRRA